MKITSKTRLQYRINSLVMVILIVCLAGLSGWLSTRYSLQMDWTQSGRHTLSDASKEVLSRMPGQVDITAYARDDVNLREAIKKIVARYQYIKPDIVLRFVNPDAVPDEVRNLGISVDGELLVRYQGRVEHIKSDNEEEFTNALQRLVRGTENWLAFIEGHGERDPLGKKNHDLSNFVQQLYSRGFKVQPINLAKIQAIPENTHVLVIAGPQVDLLPGENELIIEFIRRGGNLLWLLDPGGLKGLDPLAEELNIQTLPGMIIDFAGQLIGINDPTIVLLTASMYPPHLATREFSYTVFLPTATAIRTIENDTWLIKPVLSTADHTWLETGELQGEVKFDEPVDQRGPLDIGVSFEREIEIEEGGELITKQQRIMVLGDGDFLSNAYVSNSGNLDLGIRLINWLSSDDDFITIPARTAIDTHLELSQFSKVIIGFGFLLLLPLLLLSTGMIIWWRRRKL